MWQLPEIQGPVHTPEYAIEGVPTGDAMVAWQRAWGLLQKAVAQYPEARDAWTSDSALYMVATGQAQLWIAWSYQRRRIEGAVISRLFDKPDMAPNDKVMECPLVGGENMREWGPAMFAMLLAWARAQGCDYIAGYGRKGWKRLFGFAEMGKTPDGLPILVLPVRRH